MKRKVEITELSEVCKGIKKSDGKAVRAVAEAMIEALKNPMNYGRTR